MNRWKHFIVFALVCTSAIIFFDIGRAVACDPAEAVPIAEPRPADDALVGPAVQILAGVRGYGDTPLTLSRCATTLRPCDVEEEYAVEVVERIQLTDDDDLGWEWLVIYQPLEPLAEGLYLTQAGEFEPYIETAGFEVDSAPMAREFPTFEVDWDRVSFDDADNGSCRDASFEGARIRVKPHTTYPDIWYEVQLWSPGSIETHRDVAGPVDGKSETFAIVPGWGSDDAGVYVRSKLVMLEEVECVTVTARDLYGDRGPSVDVCEPRACANHFEPSVSDEVWAKAEDCEPVSEKEEEHSEGEEEEEQGEEEEGEEEEDEEGWKLEESPGTPSTEGCGCHTVSAGNVSTVVLLFGLMFFARRVRRRSR